MVDFGALELAVLCLRDDFFSDRGSEKYDFAYIFVGKCRLVLTRHEILRRFQKTQQKNVLSTWLFKIERFMKSTHFQHPKKYEKNQNSKTSLNTQKHRLSTCWNPRFQRKLVWSPKSRSTKTIWPFLCEKTWCFHIFQSMNFYSVGILGITLTFFETSHSNRLIGDVFECLRIFFRF